MQGLLTRTCALAAAICLAAAPLAGCKFTGAVDDHTIEYTKKSVEEIIAQLQKSLDKLLSSSDGSLTKAAALVQQQVDHFKLVYDAELAKTFQTINDTAQESN